MTLPYNVTYRCVCLNAMVVAGGPKKSAGGCCQVRLQPVSVAWAQVGRAGGVLKLNTNSDVSFIWQHGTIIYAINYIFFTLYSDTENIFYCIIDRGISMHLKP